MFDWTMRLSGLQICFPIRKQFRRKINHFWETCLTTCCRKHVFMLKLRDQNSGAYRSRFEIQMYTNTDSVQRAGQRADRKVGGGAWEVPKCAQERRVGGRPAHRAIPTSHSVCESHYDLCVSCRQLFLSTSSKITDYLRQEPASMHPRTSLPKFLNIRGS